MLVLTLPCLAQESRATLVGVVTDSSSAVVPMAQVTITNQATGVAVTAQTNEAGNYVALYLIPGVYRVACEKAGFKHYQHDGLELHVNDRVELNIPMEVGNQAEAVTVTGETPLLETATGSAGDVVEARSLSELPMPHDIPFWVMGLSPTLSCVNCIQGNDMPFDSFSNSYTFAGTRAQLSEVLVDGVPTSSTNNGPMELITSWMPPPDTVAELKVQTVTYDASVGFTEGGATNVTLKSGTNTLHGSAFFTVIPTAFVANTFFGNAIAQPRGSIIYHRWGGTVGGPVYIPRAYDGRNRTFFFAGYEGLRFNRIRGNVGTVPTAPERQGDFSALLKLGSNYQLYDPASRVSVGGGRYQESPVPGNVLPSSRISPIATNILSYYPLPIVAGTANGTNNFPEPNATENGSYYSTMGRVDHNFTEKHRIFVRVNYMERNSTAVDWFHNLATARPFEFQSRGGIVDDVYTISPTFVMNFHYGYDRFVRIYDSLPAAHGFDLTSLGFSQFYNNEIPTSIRRFPYFTISGYQSTWNGWLDRPNDNHDFTLTFNKEIGHHAIKFGPEFRAYRQNQFEPDNTSTGQLNFGTTYTQGPLDNSAASPIGQGLASMLLGISDTGDVTVNASYAEQSTTWAGYIHDDWRVSNKLTVNIGLRYEYESPITERYNRSVLGFNPTATLPISAQVASNYGQNPTQGLSPSQFNTQGGLTFAGVNGAPRGLWNAYGKSFMPRFGLAYSLGHNTVVRAGYGIYYGFLGTRRTNVIQTGFSQTTYEVDSLDGGLTFVNSLANPFPNGIQQPLGAAGGVSTGLGQAVSFFNQNPLPPYMQRWSIGVQHQLPKRVLLDVSYVGNRGTHIEIARNLDALPERYLSTLPTRDTATINNLTASVPNPFYPLLPNTNLAAAVVQRQQLLLPYPQFSSVTSTTYQGYSWYHSLNGKIEKRFSGGITVSSAYTWSKFMEATNYLNPADPMPEKVISDEDFTNRVSVSGIYELPFGRKRHWLSGINAPLNVLLGGWQVDGIFTAQTGAPLQWGDVLFNGDFHDIPLPGDKRSVAEWFNTGAGFVTASSAQLADNIQTFPLRLSNVRAPGIENFDLTALKSVKTGEKFTWQFRGDFLNAMNHPLFASPNTTPTSGAFGQITAQNNNPRRIQLSLKLLF
jgi:hypothetical protein